MHCTLNFCTLDFYFGSLQQIGNFWPPFGKKRYYLALGLGPYNGPKFTRKKSLICSKLVASLRHIVAENLPQTHFSSENYLSGALFAANLRYTVVARIVCRSFLYIYFLHTSVRQVCSTLCATNLLCTVVAHNVCHKFTAHSCRALFWHTMCATSLLGTVAMHCTVLAHNMRNSFKVHRTGANLCATNLICYVLFWHTMCATSLQCTVVAHCFAPPPLRSY